MAATQHRGWGRHHEPRHVPQVRSTAAAHGPHLTLSMASGLQQPGVNLIMLAGICGSNKYLPAAGAHMAPFLPTVVYVSVCVCLVVGVRRVLGPEPWNVCYAEPSIRPDDSR